MKLRIILFVLALLAFFSASLGGYLYYTALKKSAFKEGERQTIAGTKSVRNRVSTLLSENLKSVKALAGLNELKQVLVNPNEKTLTKTNGLLDHFRETLHANVCYLMDTEGITIASSNRNDPKSFVGKNYAFRPYFKNAIQGLPTVYMALGVTSGKRGVYYSHPVYGETQKYPAGVIVIKASVESVEFELQELRNQHESITLIIDPNGIIFMSSHKDWLYHTLWRISDEKINEILKSRQFGNGPLEWIGLERENEKHAVLNTAKKYLIHQSEIASYPGWNVVHLTSLDAISKGIYDPLIRTTGSITFFLCLFIGISVLILYQKASSDIRHRKRAELALKASEENYRAIFDAANDAVFIHDLKTGQILDVNKKMCQMYGYSAKEARLLSVEDFSSGTPPYTQDDALQWIKRAAQGEPQLFEWKAKNKAGQTFWVEVNLKRAIIGGEDRLMAVVRDITERKRAEKELRKSEQRHQAISELTSDYAYAFRVEDDGELINEWVTGALKRITGFTAEEIQSSGGWESLIYPDDMPIPMGQLQALFNKQAKVVEYRIVTKNEGIRWMRDYARPIWDDAQGRLSYILGAVQDITERKQMEEILRESELKYKNIFNNAQVGLGRTRISDGKVLESNEKMAQIFGYQNTEEFIKEFVFSEHYVDPSVREEMMKEVEKTGIANDVTTRFYRKDGKIMWARFDTQIFPEDGYMEDVVVDITKQKRLEDERNKLESKLLQAQKMEAIGTFAGGIAHDFNNILSAIVGYTELSLGKIPAKDPLHDDLQEVLGAGLRARDLVKQILTFSRQAEQKMQPVQIDLLIKEALKFLRSTLPSSIKIRSDIISDARVLADPTQIYQVLMNLCVNAKHAMRENGGVLEVSLVEAQQSEIADAHPRAAVSSYLKLTVADNGEGMSTELRKKIFDPFFTTKGKEEGTGLGLAVVHGIVQSCGGFITVSSEPGKGTIFKVFLPAIEAQDRPQAEFKGPLPLGSERVLYVDDEKLLVDIGKQMLERYGYRVIPRTSSVEALELFKAKPNQFDLVITDMTMPNMSGLELASEIIGLRPEQPIILCTGFSERITAARAETFGIKAYMLKPVSLDDLILTARKVLDESKSILTFDTQELN